MNFWLKPAGIFLFTFVINEACFSSAFRYSVSAEDGSRVGKNALKESSKMMYDFREIDSVNDWSEISDTVRLPGKSKASFAIQKSRLFQRAIFFSLLNPQPNGAGFAGVWKAENWDLNDFSGLELYVRGQGKNLVYKVILNHDEKNTDETTYETFFKVPDTTWTKVNLAFKDFKAYNRGDEVPDAPPLDKSSIASVGLQIPGGVYSDFKQSGPASLEIDYIKATK